MSILASRRTDGWPHRVLVVLALLAVASGAAAQTVPDFSATPTSGTQALLVQFTNLTTTDAPAVIYAWDFGDGTTSAFGAPAHVYKDPGTYSVSLSALPFPFTGDPIAITKPGFITVLPGTLDVDFTATPPLSGLAPLSVSFDGTNAGTANPTDWLWDFGDGGSSSEQSPTHTYVTGGDFSVTLTVSAGALQDVATKPDLVHVDPPDLDPQIALAPAVVDVADDVSFTGSSAGGSAPDSWLWDFGDGATSTQQNPEHDYAQPGVYDVSLTVGLLGAEVTTTLEDAVTVLVPELEAGINWSPAADGWAPYVVEFHGENLAPSAVHGWLWDFGDGSDPWYKVQQSPTHTYETPGTYDLTLTISKGGYSDTEVVTGAVTVLDPNLEIGLEFFPRGGITPLTVEFVDTSTADSESIKTTVWYGDGIHTQQTVSSHTYYGSNYYTPYQELITVPPLYELQQEYTNGIQVVQKSVVTFTSFSEPDGLVFAHEASHLLVADVDGDGLQDLLAELDKPSLEPDPVEVWLQRPDGSFPGPDTSFAFTFGNQFYPDLLGAADMDADGDLDLVSARRFFTPATAMVWHNDGAGGFSEAMSVAGPAGERWEWGALADVDEDGFADVALGVAPSFEPQDLWLAHGDGVGGLQAPVGPVFEFDLPDDPLVADVNGDGHLDLVGRLRDISADLAGVQLALGTGGSFAAPVEVVAVADDYAYNARFAVGDMTGDGLDDVAFLDDEVFIAVGTPGGLGAFAPLAGHPHDPAYMAFGDVDADGDDDLLLSDPDALRMGRTKADGTIALWSGLPRLADVAGPRQHVLADLEGDGDLDLVTRYTADAGEPAVSIHRNLGRVGRWVDIGGEMTGAAGTLWLEGTGELRFDTPVSFALTGAQPLAPALLVIGLSDLLAPFKGGVLVPYPDMVVGGFFTDALGGLQIDALWPGNVPEKTPSWYQVWVSEAGQLVGSNGLLAIAAE